MTGSPYFADCMKSLDTYEARKRIDEVHKAYDETFYWLFDSQSVSFGEWLSHDKPREKPIYWISGKPGSGKSTLMKFAMRNPRILEFLAKASANPWILAAFFFHGRGASETQKSLRGMLLEILHSILNQAPALLAFIIPGYLKLAKAQKTKSPQWDTQVLGEALLTITGQRKVHVQLCLFIDALDEHSGDNEQLVKLLKDIVRNSDGEIVKLKACIASRSWTVFTYHFGNCPGFEIHEYTATDICVYVESRLANDQLGSQSSLSENHLREIASQIADRAHGVFIWVRLVMDLIIKDIQDGTTFDLLERRIANMPKELEDLYADTVRRIEREHHSAAYIMLQTVLCSLTALSLDDLLTITSCNSDHPLRPSRDLSLLAKLRILSSRGGGLLEVVRSTFPGGGELDRYDVQFIHQTVKQYIREQASSISQVLQDRRSGYIFLLRSVDRGAFMLSDEIWQNTLVYAKLYEISAPAPTEDDIDLYVNLLNRILEKANITRLYKWHSSNTTLQDYLETLDGKRFCTIEKQRYLEVSLAVAANLNLYISRTGSRFNRDHSSSFSLMHIAVNGLNIVPANCVDNIRMIETLAEIGYPNDGMTVWQCKRLPLQRQRGFFMTTPLGSVLVRASIKFDRFTEDYESELHELSELSEDDRLKYARALLDLGADPNLWITWGEYNGTRIQGSTLLEYCVQYATAPLANLLLEYGADPISNSSWPLYALALLRGNQDIIQVLEECGLRADSIPTANSLMVLPSIAQACAIASHVGAAPLGRPINNLFLLRLNTDIMSRSTPNHQRYSRLTSLSIAKSHITPL